MRDLAQLGRARTRQVGAKARSLARLSELGLAVPRALVLEVDVLSRWVESLGWTSRIETLARGLSTLDPVHVENLRLELDRVLGEAPLSEEIEQALTAARSALRGRLICRSSALAEDGADEAYPGVFESRGGLESVEELAAGVRACYRSLWSERALLYARRLGRGGAWGMALILQEERACSHSGVLFTRDPVDPDREGAVVEWAQGSGERLQKAATAPVRFHRGPEGWRSEEGSAPAGLALERLDRLTEAANGLRRAWGEEVDAEFGFEAEEARPWFFQCRPITTPTGSALDRPSRPLEGVVCAAGSARGLGIDLENEEATRGSGPRVLLVERLLPEHYPLLFDVVGVVAERPQSRLHHLSIACRELGVVYLAGVENARQRFAGRRLALDSATGVASEEDSTAATSAVAAPFAPNRSADAVASLASLAYLEPGREPIAFTGLTALLLLELESCSQLEALEIRLAERIGEASEGHGVELIVPSLEPSTRQYLAEALGRGSLDQGTVEALAARVADSLGLSWRREEDLRTDRSVRVMDESSLPGEPSERSD